MRHVHFARACPKPGENMKYSCKQLHKHGRTHYVRLRVSQDGYRFFIFRADDDGLWLWDRGWRLFWKEKSFTWKVIARLLSEI
jgi:hypothetical protein